MFLALVICTLAYVDVQANMDDRTTAESDNPSMAYLENPLIFKQIGLMFPTPSYAHPRTTLDIKDLDLAVNKTCMYKDSLKILRHYNIGYNHNQNLSPNVKQEVSDSNQSQIYPTEGFTFYLDNRLIQLSYQCRQANDTAQFLKGILYPDLL